MLIKTRQSEIFLKNWQGIQSGKYRYIINEGGSRSSKTFSLIQCYLNLAGLALSRLTIWRLKRTWTKASVYNDFISYIKSLGIYNKADSNETDLIYRFAGSQIEFNGMDDYQKIHGLTQDYAWLNEAMEANKEDFEQIDMRTKKMLFFDYNPTEEEHWIYDLKRLPETLVIHSTQLDNPFLEAALRRKILSYEPTEENIKRHTADTYKWKVYGLGLPAKREGLIYSYEIIKEWPPETQFVGYGLDFGFFPDPSACAKIGLYDGRLVIDEMFYEQNLTYISQKDEDSIEKRLRENGIRNELIIADSASKTGIKELRIAGFNIYPCFKYAGSVKDGIELVQNYQPILVTERSLNAKKELDNYTWVKDIRTDTFTKEPIDDYNHCFAAETKIITNKGLKQIKDIKFGDLILTSKGYNRVLINSITGYKKIFYYRLKFVNFEVELRCTPDHLIKTSKGWKQIKQLKIGEQIFLSKYLMEKNTDYIQAKDIFQEVQKDSMLLYGNIIMVKYLKDTIRIIRMKILTITRLKILRLLKLKYINHIMPEKESNKIQNGLINFKNWGLRQQRNGINQKMAENGTPNNKKEHGQKGIVQNELAYNVGTNTKQGQCKQQNFVPIIVSQHIEGVLKQTMKKEYANYADLNFRSINMQGQDFVQKYVLQNIDIISERNDYVYDLLIENEHEFFANGILVHNCLDLLRYVIQKRQRRTMGVRRVN